MVRLSFDVDWFFVCLLFVTYFLHIIVFIFLSSFIIIYLFLYPFFLHCILFVGGAGRSREGGHVRTENPDFFCRSKRSVLAFYLRNFYRFLSFFFWRGGRGGNPRGVPPQRASHRGSSRFPFFFSRQGAFSFLFLDGKRKSSLG